MTRQHCFGFVALSLATALAATTAAAQGTTTRQVQVAVLSWMLDSVVIKQPQSIAAVCISSARLRLLNGKPAPMTADGDLDSLTLAALPLRRLPLLPGSACAIHGTSPLPTVLKGTTQQAVGLQIGPVEIDSTGQATVQAEYRINGRWGGGYTCTIRNTGATWAVVRCTATWIA